MKEKSSKVGDRKLKKVKLLRLFEVPNNKEETLALISS